MTNTERARRYRRLADYIERQPEENFNMRRYFCGSAACMAGHGALMLGWTRGEDLFFDVQRKGSAASARTVTRRYLGLGDFDAALLFQPLAPWQTRDAAVAELRRRAEEEEKRA